MSEPINEIAAAIAKAQAKLSAPPRNREVEVVSKRTGAKYKFRYATLDSIIEHVRAPLTDNGLWFTQTLVNGGGKYHLVTQLIHSSGQRIVSETPILADSADNQAFGSALTYMKRYALSALLGIAADEDDDANAADGNTVESSKDRVPAMKNKLAAVTSATKEPDPPSRDWTAEARIIFKKMEKAEDQDERDLILSDKAEVLKEILKHNPKAHTEIMKISTGKQEAA